VWDDNKRCNLLIKFLKVSYKKNNLTVNIEITKFKVTVRVNWKWLNLHYPSFSLVGKHLTFPVTTKLYIPWVEVLFRP